MKKLIILHQFLLLILHLNSWVKGQHEQEKVNINVYYESLCPDSQKFIKFRLKEAFIKFNVDMIGVKLIPFGNANVRHIYGLKLKYFLI